MKEALKKIYVAVKYRSKRELQIGATCKMYKTLFLALTLPILFWCCDKDSTSSHSEKTTLKNIEKCIEPHNPYNDGGGHDAGFKWAIENGGDCNGNSDSFNEGCEEYYSQLDQYNQCIALNRE